MELNDRKKQILQAVIDEYISSAEPVGSRAISKKNELGLSSATIRNEMADLEEMGYLIQPHTSAGRIPSDAGYRFYVNTLMRRYQLGLEAIERLRDELAGRIDRLDRAVKRAGFLTAMLTDYTTVISAPTTGLAEIKKLDIVQMSDAAIMLVIITDTVHSRVINTDMPAAQCERLSAALNNKLRGRTAEDLTYEMIQSIENEVCGSLGIEPRTMINILNFVYDAVSAPDEGEIYVANAQNLLKYPEFRDPDTARELLGVLEDKDKLRKLIAAPSSGEVKATIGNENGSEILKDSSIVTVNYSLDGKAVGKVGVIGPKRMDYAKVFASLDLISHEINKLVGYITSDD